MTEKTNEQRLIEILEKDCSLMKRYGFDLAEAAARVVREYDGIHRLSIAVSNWYRAIADESGRGEAHCKDSDQSSSKEFSIGQEIIDDFGNTVKIIALSNDGSQPKYVITYAKDTCKFCYHPKYKHE